MAARRPYGEGSVHYRESRKKWVGTISRGKDETGKRRRETIYGRSKSEVLHRLREIALRGPQTERERKRMPTIREYIKQWLEDEVKPNLRATTARSYKGLTERYIIPSIGAVRVNQLDPTGVKRCLKFTRTHKTPSARSIEKHVYVVLRVVMAAAVRDEKATRNPVDNVTPPKVLSEREPRFLGADEVQRLFAAAANDRFEALAVILSTAGARVGEALALRWENIDFEKASMKIEATSQETTGEIKRVDPKTKAGKREVALGEIALRALRRRRIAAKAEGFSAPTDLVFPTPSGTPMRLSNLHRRWWRPFLQRAEIADVRIHDLRHTSASLHFSPVRMRKRSAQSSVIPRWISR